MMASGTKELIRGHVTKLGLGLQYDNVVTKISEIIAPDPPRGKLSSRNYFLYFVSTSPAIHD